MDSKRSVELTATSSEVGNTGVAISMETKRKLYFASKFLTSGDSYSVEMRIAMNFAFALLAIFFFLRISTFFFTIAIGA